MSFNRENVIWQTADGTWGRGFFRCYDVGDPTDEDFDSEWDVDYDFETFEWVRTGLPSERAAELAWDGANPGGWWTTTEPGDAARYDAMAAALRNR